MMANSDPTGSPMDEMKLSTKTAAYPAETRKWVTGYLCSAIGSAVIFGAGAAGRKPIRYAKRLISIGLRAEIPLDERFPSVTNCHPT
jgi:hypothetical protein